jgi:hypothetical protein
MKTINDMYKVIEDNENFVYDLAQVAFETYSKSRNNLTYDGKDIPTWDKLPIDIKASWVSVVKVVWMLLHDNSK